MGGNRVLREERILPTLSFRIPVEITFSIATTQEMAEAITYDIGNLNKVFTEVCKEIIYKDLNLKNKEDVNYYFSEFSKLIKGKIYKDLKIDLKNHFGTEYMVKQLLSYIKKNKNRLNICKSEVYFKKF